jgi:asparagine synthetase B (glutamine-hydrolysing)
VNSWCAARFGRSRSISLTTNTQNKNTGSGRCALLPRPYANRIGEQDLVGFLSAEALEAMTSHDDGITSIKLSGGPTSRIRWSLGTGGGEFFGGYPAILALSQFSRPVRSSTIALCIADEVGIGRYLLDSVLGSRSPSSSGPIPEQLTTYLYIRQVLSNVRDRLLHQRTPRDRKTSACEIVEERTRKLEGWILLMYLSAETYLFMWPTPSSRRRFHEHVAGLEIRVPFLDHRVAELFSACRLR